MNGKSDPLEKLFAELYPQLIRYVRSKVAEQDAHDLVQASLEVLAAKRDQVEDPRKFAFGVASNKIKQHYEQRSRGIVGAIMSLDEVPVATLSTRLSIRVARDNDLEVAMQQLTRRQYEAFELRYIEKFEIAVVAEILEVSPATVKREIERAREKLASVLGDQTDEAELGRIIRAYLRE